LRPDSIPPVRLFESGRIRPSVALRHFVRSPTTRSEEEAMSVIVEIRAAEGGDDAKTLVDEQFAIYAKRALRDGL